MEWMMHQKYQGNNSTTNGEERYSTSGKAVITVTEHLAYVFAVALLVVLPITAIIIKGTEGAVISGIAIFLTLPITVNIFRSVKTISFWRFLLAVRQLVGTQIFQLCFLVGLNLWIIFRVGLQTLIPVYSLIGLFLITSFICCLLLYLKQSGKVRKRTGFVSVVVGASMVNTALLINFVFSQQPSTEKHHFVKSMEGAKGASGKSRFYLQHTTLIMLDQQKYDAYPGIRVFSDYEQMKNATYIKYTFRKGLLGIRVVTDFEFE
jgi:hypothetical protein